MRCTHLEYFDCASVFSLIKKTQEDCSNRPGNRSTSSLGNTKKEALLSGYRCIQLFEMCDEGLLFSLKSVINLLERIWGQVSFPDRSNHAQCSQKLFWLLNCF